MSRRIYFIVSMLLVSLFPVYNAASQSTITTNSDSLTITSLREENITNKKADIKWTTNLISSSSVSYGLSAGLLDQSSVKKCSSANAGSVNATTDHCVKLDKLKDSTTYYYKVVSETDDGERSTEDGQFTTTGKGGTASTSSSTSTPGASNTTTNATTPTPTAPVNTDDSAGSSPTGATTNAAPPAGPTIPIVPQPITGTLSGKVSDSFGSGVDGAMVQVYDVNGTGAIQTVDTNAFGRYSFVLDAGRWVVSLVTTATTPYVSDEPTEEVEIFAGQATQHDIEVSTRDAIINGEVHDVVSGDIIDDFSGTAYLEEKGSRGSTQSTEIINGEFTMSTSAGTYKITIEAESESSWIALSPVTMGVMSGDIQELVLRAKRKTAIISGSIRDQSGEIITGVPFTVVASGKQGRVQRTEIDIETGGYTIDVAEGKWFLRAYPTRKQDKGAYFAQGREIRVKARDHEVVTRDITIVRANARVTGKVVAENNDGVARVWVSADSRSLKVSNRDTKRLSRHIATGAYTDESGNFTLNVPAGRYFIRAHARSVIGAENLTGAANPAEQKVKAVAGQDIDITLRLRSPNVTFNGTVLIGDKPVSAAISAWSEKGGFLEEKSNANGHVELTLTKDDIWHISASLRKNGQWYKSAVANIHTNNHNNISQVLILKSKGSIAPPETRQINTLERNIIRTNDGAKIDAPRASIGNSGSATLTINPDPEMPEHSTTGVIGVGYDVKAYDSFGNAVTALSKEVTISLPYDTAVLNDRRVEAADLSVAFWDVQAETWIEIETSVVNQETQTVSAITDHFTRFAIVAAADITPPDPPAGASAYAQADGSIVLTWSNPTTDFNHAKIYRSDKEDDLGTVIVTDLIAATYTDTTAQPHTSYFYTIRAVDPAGNESTNIDQIVPGTRTVSDIAKNLAGRILLQVEQNGEAWYVHTEDYNRYFLSRPKDAFDVMQSLGLGISNDNINKLPIGLTLLSGTDTDGDGLSDIFEDAIGSDTSKADTDSDGFSDQEEVTNGYDPAGSGKSVVDSGLVKALEGKILLQVEQSGEAWYLDPTDKKRYFLGRPHDAFTIMRTLGLGITNADLAQIFIAPDSAPVP